MEGGEEQGRLSFHPPAKHILQKWYLSTHFQGNDVDKICDPAKPSVTKDLEPWFFTVLLWDGPSLSANAQTHTLTDAGGCLRKPYIHGPRFGALAVWRKHVKVGPRDKVKKKFKSSVFFSPSAVLTHQPVGRPQCSSIPTP